MLTGFNDLATTHPDVAKEADGWDPTTVTRGAKQKLPWKCSLGHTWKATANNRTNAWHAQGCPYCANKRVWQGFNDLATLFPEVAKEAHGWDPSQVAAGSSSHTRKWKCSSCSHEWETTPNSRAGQEAGCPECSEGGGYKTSLPGWFYLLERPGEQQLGITNFKEDRLKTHANNGWEKVEVVGPAEGSLVLETEKRFKHWLRTKVGLVPGTHENWFSAKLEVRSLAELKAKSDVETELF